MIFSTTFEGVSLILLHPLLQITSKITKPIEEQTLSNPSISFRREIGCTICIIISIQRKIVEASIAYIVGVYDRSLLHQLRCII